MAAEATDRAERLLELRDLATGEVRRFVVVRDDTTSTAWVGMERVGHAAPNAATPLEAREALAELFGGPIEQTAEERSALLTELGLRA
jgi:hypothetical protein